MEVDEDIQQDPIPAYLTILMGDSSTSQWLSCIIDLKNAVIGSNREKSRAVEQGLVPRLLGWIEDGLCPLDLKTEAAIVLGSLAKGGQGTVQKLVDAKTVSVLLKSLNTSNQKYCEAVLRCLRSIYMENTECINILYEENSFGSSYIPTLLAMTQQSLICQECVTNIFVCCCKTKEHQMCLLNSQALPILSPLLQSSQYKIQMPTLRFFAKVCYKNTEVCNAIAKEAQLVETFVHLMSRDKPTEMQMAAAEMLTNLHRCGVIPASDFIISRKTLGTLVRMCMRDRTVEENVRGAEVLAYLIEIDPDLQLTASYTFHLIGALATCLHYQDTDKPVPSSGNKDVDWGSEMRRAAFLAFASISANDEEIREKVIKQEGMIEHIQTSLSSKNDGEVAASLRCLQSLTRSVQQIRTVLHDNAVWKPLLEKVRSGNKEIKVLAMSCLCNLVLEFSPSKEALVENHAVDVLCGLCQSEDNIVRLNATWGIMSFSYYASEELRTNIINKLGTDTLVRRIQDPVLLIREKALCIVRNLLAGKMSIDNTVKLLGNEVIEAVFKILSEDNMPSNVVTQALCALSNMADGPSCKAYMIAKTDEINSVVKYLQYTEYPDKNLLLPAIQFVSNLVDTSDDGSYQRMLQLKTLGVQTLLESLVGIGLDEVEPRAQQALKYFA